MTLTQLPFALEEANGVSSSAAVKSHNDAYPWTLEVSRDFSGTLAAVAAPQIPCWTSREQCLIAINLALFSPQGVQLRRKYEVSVPACMGAARTDAATADAGTGRNVQTSHGTAARRMERLYGLARAARTYRKARDVLRLLGFQVVVDEGRYLTKTERLAAALVNGDNGRRPPQRRKASTRVFTMAKFSVEMIGHLPRRGSTIPKLNLISTHQERANARSAAPPKLRTKRKTKIQSWDLPMQRLAARMVNEATFLRSRSVRTWHICRELDQAGIDPALWSAQELVRLMYAAVTNARWTAPVKLRNPLGYFRYLLGTISQEQIAAHVARKGKAEQLRQERLASARAATRRAAQPKRLPQEQPKSSWRERCVADYAAGMAQAARATL